ncbi:TPM domain-containing protein [Mangrovibrevibacter kandeliae]|uniref:TPM domain-containing protein n=1 Tax=Mangrovibrevibacter kandeliae TaxID=2968473 RepID=UPI002119AACD|nr:TPM domain-containing protein [Aurantimonas sp. CSK15Z-1]MCQ8783568.1 TPM domain-containing protein [Aurantimonas sp. CSK15Z-1]
MAGVAFTPEEHRRIAQAIRTAEATTRGEIYCVFARRSDRYGFVSACVVLALALAAGWLAVLVAALAGLPVTALEVVAGQTLAGALLYAVAAASPSLRMMLVPRAGGAPPAGQLARVQCQSPRIHPTSERTGVLIFVSAEEHHAEIVADEGIDAKVPQEDWNAIVEALVEAARGGRFAEGYEDAIARAGALLSRHFPGGSDNPNELPDRLVEL